MRDGGERGQHGQPSAPPTCCVVLTTPDARPASSAVAPDIASVISAGNAEAGAHAEQQHHRQHLDDVLPVDRRPGEAEQAGGDQPEPRHQHRRAHRSA